MLSLLHSYVSWTDDKPEKARPDAVPNEETTIGRPSLGGRSDHLCRLTRKKRLTFAARQSQSVGATRKARLVLSPDEAATIDTIVQRGLSGQSFARERQARPTAQLRARKERLSTTPAQSFLSHWILVTPFRSCAIAPATSFLAKMGRHSHKHGNSD